MKEEFLNYIWQYQYFKKDHLRSYQGDPVTIMDPGQLNSHAGPDFSHARIKIRDTEWAGQVEIHIKSSDWFLHNHHNDPSYDQVILHVVWSNNRPAVTCSGRVIPTLVLKDRVSDSMLLKHRTLISSSHHIPCNPLSAEMDKGVLDNMLHRTIRQRLARKSTEILELLRKNEGDWDQVTYIMFGRNFGFHVNGSAFASLVAMVPLSIVRRVRSSLLNLEALFFGQAGFLGKVSGDSYYLQLQLEYEYLKYKYNLVSRVFKRSVWRYLRLRPSNFPALRIAQFASLMQQEGYRFSGIRELKAGNPMLHQLQPSSYWQTHYDFGKVGGSGGRLGKSSRENLLINTAVPLLVAYAEFSGNTEFHIKAMEILRNLPSEHNRILSYWKDTGFEVSSAYDSQALIELNNEYCTQKKCLGCEIGKSLLTL